MNRRDTLLMMIVVVFWGGNFAVSKAGLVDFPPILFIALRFVLVAALLVPLVPIPRARLPALLGLSVTLGLFHFSLMFTGLKAVDASVAAIAIQVQVPFAALLGAMFFKERLTRQKAVGMAVAIAGVAILAGGPDADSALWAVGLIVAAALVWTVANIQMKSLVDLDGFALNGWMALFAAPQLALASLVLESGQWRAIQSASLMTWSAIVYQAVIVVILCYGIWYALLRRHSVARVIPYTLLVPVFGVLSGVVFLGDRITLSLIAGGLATIAGVAIINLQRLPLGR
ncbi:MAG: EamA family transporter [Inquilinaceae bacterium]